MKDNGNILVTGHVLIRDTETQEVLVNTSGNKTSIHSLLPKQKKIDGEKNNGN